GMPLKDFWKRIEILEIFGTGRKILGRSAQLERVHTIRNRLTMPDDFSLIELRALHEIARVLSHPSELKDQLQETLDVLSARLGMERGMISVLDLQTGEAWLDVARGV